MVCDRIRCNYSALETEVRTRLTVAAVGIAAAMTLTGSVLPFASASAAPARHATTKPAKHAAPLLGVDVYGQYDYTTAQVTKYGKRLFPYLHKTLKVQVVGLMWDMCTANKTSNVVSACKPDAKLHAGTMSAADIEVLGKLARAAGLQVAMRPIIRVGSPSGWNSAQKSWEGYINPKDYSKWFSNLLKAYEPYFKSAKTVGTEQFVIASELFSLKHTTLWSGLLSKAHTDCHCTVSYAAQDTEFEQNSKNLPPVKAFGVDLYPALNLKYQATQREVTVGWEKALSKLPESKLEKTSLDEISIRATEGAYLHPSNWGARGHTDAYVQERYFTAACETAAHYHMTALFFYFVPLSDNPAHPVKFPAYFLGKTTGGAKALMGCPKILATGAIK